MITDKQNFISEILHKITLNCLPMLHDDDLIIDQSDNMASEEEPSSKDFFDEENYPYIFMTTESVVEDPKEEEFVGQTAESGMPALVVDF